MSPDPVTFGYLLSPRAVLFGVSTVSDMFALAREVDASGAFGSLWVGDSLLSKPRPDSLAVLGALAAATKSVSLGTACMASFPLRDPIVLAYQWANLDVISKGRMMLAACTGIVKPEASEREGAYWGVSDKERAARLEEHIEICRRLWSEDHVSFSGTYRVFEDLTLQPRPLQQPCPIWIAANPSNPTYMERSMQRVARLADGWMSADVFPDLLAANWEKLHGYLRAEGRDPDAFPVALVHNLNINEDRDAAFEETSRFLDEYYGPVLPQVLKESWSAYGSPADCVERVQKLVRDGAKQIIFRPTTWDLRGQYRRLIEEVLPQLN